MTKGFGVMIAMAGAFGPEYRKSFDTTIHAAPKGKQYWFDLAYGKNPELTGEYYRDERGCLRKSKDSATVI